MKVSPKNKSNQTNRKQTSANRIIEFLNKDISFSSGNLSDKKKEHFYNELSVMLNSGIDSGTAINLIAEQDNKAKDKELFGKINQLLIKGKSLSEALRQTNKFSAYEYYSIQIGEETGNVGVILRELNDYFSKKIAQKRKLMNAFSYPVLVIVTSFIAVWFMMKFIVPMFVDVFKRFQGELPALTQRVINFSNFVDKNSWFLLLIALTLVVVHYVYRTKSWYRKLTSAILIRIPYFGELVIKTHVARFCQSMALLIGSRVPMIRAISLVEKMIGFYPFEKAMTNINDDILHGKSLHKSLQDIPLFEPRLVSLVKVGEEVNQLEKIFSTLYEQYTNEIEHRTATVSTVLEPFMIVFVGVLVGVVLISMYLPLFKLSSTFM